MSERTAHHKTSLWPASDPQQKWMRDALCAQVDTEIFFPDKGGNTAPALRICHDCPVAAECLDFALATRERHGIWGGVTERARRGLTGEPLEHDVDVIDDLTA